MSGSKKEKEQTDNKPVDDHDQKYQVYLDERKSLNDARKETSHLFDKSILTLAAGALALSLTFIKDISPAPKPETLWLLLISWGLFIASILSTLISFFASQRACSIQIEILENDYFPENGQMSADKKDNPYNKYTQWLNTISITSFTCGVLFLILFSSANFPDGKEKSMAKGKAVTDPSKVGGGYVPPSQPVKRPPIKKGK
jgi:hypothetical protein